MLKRQQRRIIVCKIADNVFHYRVIHTIDVMIFDLKNNLLLIERVLRNHPGESADWLASIIEFCDKDEKELYRQLNSKRMWGGAGSIANQALADNPGMDDWAWQAEIRTFRELMIELGSHLQARGNAYPDISSWLLAFSNWNQSEV